MYPVTVTGIWLESCLYGVYGAVFYAYMYLRRNSGLGKGTSPRVVWVLIVLFILSTISLVLEQRRKPTPRTFGATSTTHS
ncbi:hypothetical protein NEOLEDRAFT_1132970 [Neolentinus lepideus HHB14362 ss-1]|uniref:Uncharacterized protein n=1 Tax=Neolentinus lepideus HHB14362 ss-1 TaxID=1314782 RepID=A0A165SZY4_9AGAM|nr:hypothetical protein NEOLEDRAFT_1132970 [Neolentinus lepideus HHB14362 ss-1]